MTYDLEKYRDKREKVLGVRKRGISFGMLASLVSLIIVLGLGVTVVPKAIAYLNTRHLDDAIYKVQGDNNWPHSIIAELKNIPGVKGVAPDPNGTRMIITFNKTTLEPASLKAFFKEQGLKTVLLNRVSHQQRIKTLKKEAEF